MRITAIRLQRLVVPLDPPFAAAWDPGPAHGASPVTHRPGRDRRGRRRHRLGRHDGRVRGVRAPVRRRRTRWPSPGTSASSRRSTSTPVATGRSRRRCGTSSGRSRGCRSRRCSAARPTASRPTPRAGCCCRPRPRAESALRLREEGFRALKIRIDPRATLDEGLAAVAATRAAVGDTMAIMVDLNQGWRMAGDTTVGARSGRGPRRSPPSSPSTTSSGWRSRSPAPTCAGWPRCGPPRPGVRIAGGEMTRTFAETLAALDADAFDVYQPDVVLAGGMLRTRTVAELALARNRWFTPAHLDERARACWPTSTSRPGVGGGPFIEYPVRPAGLDPGAPRRLPGRADPPGPRRRPARAGAPGPRRRARRGGHRAVRGMTRRPPRSRPTAGLARPRGRGRAAQPRRSSTAGSCPRRPAEPSPTSPVATAARITDVAEGDVEDVDRAVAAARTAFDDRRWADQSPAEPQARAAQARRAHPGEPRRAGAARVARRRQADPRHARRSTSRRRPRPSSGTPRRSTRSTARSARPVPTRCRSSPASRSGSSPRSCPGTTR